MPRHHKKSAPGNTGGASCAYALFITRSAALYAPFLLFPILTLSCLVVETDIALMPTGCNFPFLKRCENRTALLFYMGAAGKPALLQIRLKFSEGGRKVLLAAALHLFSIKGGESRGIRYNRSILQPEQFHVTSGVSAPPQLVAYLAHREPKARLQRIENT